MKKILFTWLALVFGATAALAQSIPGAEITTVENSQGTLVIDKMVHLPNEEEQHVLHLYSLPEIVLEQLKYSELAALTILKVTEIAPPPAIRDALTLYELVLQNDAEEAIDEHLIVVRYNEHGKLISKKEVPLLAQENK